MLDKSGQPAELILFCCSSRHVLHLASVYQIFFADVSKISAYYKVYIYLEGFLWPETTKSDVND